MLFRSMYKMLTYLQRRKYRRLKVLSKNTLSGKILPSCSSTNTLSHMKRYHLTMADKNTGLQCCLHRLRKKFVQQWISISKHFLPCWRSRRRIIHMVCRLNSPYLWRTNTLSQIRQKTQCLSVYRSCSETKNFFIFWPSPLPSLLERRVIHIFVH